MSDNKLYISLIFIFIYLFNQPAYSKHIHLEKEYQHKWCSQNCGVEEYRLKYNTLIDCLTQTHAIDLTLRVNALRA